MSGLVGLWIGLQAFTLIAWVQSLIWELRSYKLCGMFQKTEREKNKYTVVFIYSWVWNNLKYNFIQDMTIWNLVIWAHVYDQFHYHINKSLEKWYLVKLSTMMKTFDMRLTVTFSLHNHFMLNVTGETEFSILLINFRIDHMGQVATTPDNSVYNVIFLSAFIFCCCCCCWGHASLLVGS